MSERTHIGLGSNLAEREENIAEAVRRVGDLPSTQVRAVSSLYETHPVGRTDQPLFVNAVVEADSDLEPEDLMGRLLEIEAAMGRVRSERNGPRIIDLDLLLMGDRVVDSDDLTIPHPRMSERHFVLVPLMEIAPEARDPGTGAPWRDVLDHLAAEDWGRRID